MAILRGPVEATYRKRVPPAIAVDLNWQLNQPPSPPAGTVVCRGLVEARAPRRRRWTDEPSLGLVTSTLSSPPVVVAPFAPVEYPSRVFRRASQDLHSSSRLLLSAVIQIPGSEELGTPRRRIGDTTDESPNLLLGTFSIVPQAVLPFPSGEWPIRPAKRFSQADGWPNAALQTLGLIPPAVLPFSSGEWPKAPPRRFGTLTEAPNLAITTLALTVVQPPFTPMEWAQARIRRITSDPTQNVSPLLSAQPVGIDLTQIARRALRTQEVYSSATLGVLKLPPPVVLPFPSGEWPIKPPKRFSQDAIPPNWALVIPSAGLPIVGTTARERRILRLKASERVAKVSRQKRTTDGDQDA